MIYRKCPKPNGVKNPIINCPQKEAQLENKTNDST